MPSFPSTGYVPEANPKNIGLFHVLKLEILFEHHYHLYTKIKTEISKIILVIVLFF